MKLCPYCAEKIHVKAIKCKHCGEWLSRTNTNIKKTNLRFGGKLKMLRLNRNMTLKTMSKLSGVQMATLSRMENNKVTGNIKNYMSIAKVLGLRLSDLFAEVEGE